MDHVREFVKSDVVYKNGITGKGITICVLDSGLYPHVDLMTPHSRIIRFVDFIENRISLYDDNGHGTHVTGIIGGNGEASGGKYRGIAPEASFVILKVLDKNGEASLSPIMYGLEWVLRNYKALGIRIVNISVGANDGIKFGQKSDFVKLVERVWECGIVVVAAAGNDGPKPGSISAPGNSRKVITVGASDIFGQNGIYSGIGPLMDGSCIRKPDIVAPGYRVTSCGLGQNTYAIKSGSSMSTAVVSGGIALLLSRYPNMTNREVKVRLKTSAKDLGFPHARQGWGALCVKDSLPI